MHGDVDLINSETVGQARHGIPEDLPLGYAVCEHKGIVERGLEGDLNQGRVRRLRWCATRRGNDVW